MSHHQCIKITFLVPSVKRHGTYIFLFFPFMLLCVLYILLQNRGSHFGVFKEHAFLAFILCMKDKSKHYSVQTEKKKGD